MMEETKVPDFKAVLIESPFQVVVGWHLEEIRRVLAEGV
jgi:hypothetical protein